MSIWDKRHINIQSEGMIFSENSCKIMPSSISNRSSQVWSSCHVLSPFCLFCLLYLVKAVDVLPCLAGTEPQASNTMTVGKRERNPGIVSILKVQERSYAYPRVSPSFNLHRYTAQVPHISRWEFAQRYPDRDRHLRGKISSLKNRLDRKTQ